GLLIALEGIDGSGKSTQAEMLAAYLKKDGHQVILTREPTNGTAGQKLQAYLLGPSRHLSPAEELELFMEDRREHVEQVIKPALERGKVVITDRYYYSSVAYQGALGLDPNDILAANEVFAPAPDLIFILELPVTAALARLAKKGQAARQVSESLPYLKQVEAVYASLKGPRFRRVEAFRPPMEVHRIILEETRKALKEAA
ncbi:MAG: dTMP kinase, partial [Deltaproteobacteria bacterium]|nr:dTMP kinase [Deltaproteobacteria bacterium]